MCCVSFFYLIVSSNGFWLAIGLQENVAVRRYIFNTVSTVQRQGPRISVITDSWTESQNFPQKIESIVKHGESQN